MKSCLPTTAPTTRPAPVFEDWAAKQSFPSNRVWQEHAGFRRARILNLAIARAASAYLVFLDGDTVPHPAFVADHLRLARPGTFVQGHRALIEQAGASFFGLGDFAADRRRALFRRQLRGLKHAYRWPWPACRYRSDLRGIRGCNLAIWRDDLLKVNGYNEAFTGWGREDSELAVRLMNTGARRLDVRGWAICYHLWHAPCQPCQPSRQRPIAPDCPRAKVRLVHLRPERPPAPVPPLTTHPPVICHLPSAIRHLPSAICHLRLAIGYWLFSLSPCLVRHSPASRRHSQIPERNRHHYRARSAQMISLSFRAYTCRLAKAGCDQTTGRPQSLLVGSSRCARLISS